MRVLDYKKWGKGEKLSKSGGYTPGTITGTIAAPCCSTSADPVTEPSCVYPEYWCCYCEDTWSLQDGVEVVLTYGVTEVATTTTNEDGEYTFTNVPPAKNYVITAYCPDYPDDRPLVKDVALKVVEGKTYDAKITDCVSTALGLVVDYLVENTTVLGPEEIVLDGVIAGIPNFYGFLEFKKLVLRICEISPGCVNLFEDEKVPDYLCRAAQEIGRKVLPDLDLGCTPGFTGGGYTPTVVNYTLTTVANPPEGGTVSGAGTYTSGTVVPVTASPTTGWTFTGWSGDLGGNTNPTNITMDSNKAVTATFNKEQVTLTVSVAGAGSGTVDPTVGAHTYNYGDVVVLTATPGTGSTFGGWSGDITDSNELSSITMNGDKAVTATFAANTGCLLVKVYNPEGAGYEAGWVKLFNNSMTFGPYDTDANGWYTFTNIPVGTYTLTATRPGNSGWISPSVQVTITIGAVCQEVELRYTN